MSAPKTTIYIAEDHVSVRKLLTLYLNRRGDFDIVGEATDGIHVVEDVVRLKPQILILDIGLPGVGGLEIARAISKQMPSAQILMFSSHFDPTTVRLVLQAGARGMVEKTASLETLMQAIEAVVAGRAFYGPQVVLSMQRAFGEGGRLCSLDELTNREREVLQLVAGGSSNKEVSQQLGVSLRTAENHRHNLMRKFNAHNAADLTREAFRLGLLSGQGEAPPASPPLP